MFTLLPKAEIEALTAQHYEAPHLRILQKALAQDVTTRVHSESEYLAAVEASEILFGKGDIAALRGLSEDTLLAVFEGVPFIPVSRQTYAEAPLVTDLLSEATGGQIFDSKGEAKRMIQNGGVSVNREKVALSTPGHAFELLHGQYLVVQKGKKNYYLVAVK